MYYNQNLGKHGEDIACKYLKISNYSVLGRNFKCRQGEIDIIANDNKKNELVFVEVKTRTNFNFGKPAQSVNFSKQRHLINAANYYIYKNNLFKSFIRFDVIEVFMEDCSFKVNHIKNILF